MKHKEIDLTEDFKTIKNFSNYYINKDGVVGKKLPNGKLRVYEADNRGSLLITDDSGKPRRKRQSHLVAETFLKNYRANQRIYFKDGNKLNTNLDNLFIDDTEFEDEVWKDIPNFPNYQISSKGRVRSLDRIQIVLVSSGSCYQRTLKGRILSLRNSYGSFYCLMTDNDGNVKNISVSSLYKKMFEN